MSSNKDQDYSVLDHPQVTAYVFHPRSDYPGRPSKENRDDIMIPVDDHVEIGASFHSADKSGPTILFFHGNGEIVSDYDDFGQFYNAMGINLFVADYRGYGRSTGSPSVSAMMNDCHKVYDYMVEKLIDSGYHGPVIIMGRSLGSASAIELAATHQKKIAALIIESGFAYADRLLMKLGINPDAIGFDEKKGFGNLDKMGTCDLPCLIIHAEHDHIIPFSDGQALFDICPAQYKKLLKIERANHNDIFLHGMEPYLQAVKEICFL